MCSTHRCYMCFAFRTHVNCLASPSSSVFKRTLGHMAPCYKCQVIDCLGHHGISASLLIDWSWLSHCHLDVRVSTYIELATCEHVSLEYVVHASLSVRAQARACECVCVCSLTQGMEISQRAGSALRKPWSTAGGISLRESARPPVDGARARHVEQNT